MKFQVNYKYAHTGNNRIRSAQVLFEAQTAEEARKIALETLAREVESGAFQITGVIPFGSKDIPQVQTKGTSK